jgi:uncharacterized protein (TIGR03435 family)
MATALARAKIVLIASALLAQSRETFDVTSVKVNTDGGGGGYPGLAAGGQRFTATRLPLVALIMVAYDVTPGQVVGVPGFFTEFYDVEGKCDHPITKEQASHMFQALLADRFKLTVHRESREQPIYALVVGKNGVKLHESQEDIAPPQVKQSGTGFVVKSAPMATLTLILSQVVGRTVVDKTGLTGRYDFTLQYTPERARREGEAASNPDGLPSIFTALQEQLGLKLESQKGPVEFIVVDHAEKPSGN